jgi:hypothetical protein
LEFVLVLELGTGVGMSGVFPGLNPLLLFVLLRSPSVVSELLGSLLPYVESPDVSAFVSGG